MKWAILFLAVFSFMSTPALACGGDKDSDKDRPKESRDFTAVQNCGDKDKDKDDY